MPEEPHADGQQASGQAYAVTAGEPAASFAALVPPPYQLRHLLAQQEALAIAGAWRPYRTLAASHLLPAAPHPPRRHRLPGSA